MITPDDEQLILEYHDSKLSAIPNIGRVIPAPLFFRDKRDFLATWEQSSEDTQTELETSLVRFCSFSLNRFEDAPESAVHSPLVSLHYGVYLFSEYDLEREDPNETAAHLERRMLKRHREFIQTYLEIKGAYQGEFNLGVLNGTTFVRQLSGPMTAVETIQERVKCRYIPQVFGHAVDLETIVRVQLKEC